MSELMLNEGDIFRWSWKPEVESNRRNHSSDPYWCRSRMAIVRNGRLQDTYWSSGSEGHLSRDDVDLEFQGNPADMTKINEWDRVLYRAEDIVDTRHSNNSRGEVYVKPGAKRDPETMLEYYRYKHERALSDARWATERAAECLNIIAKIGAGETEGNYPVWS